MSNLVKVKDVIERVNTKEDRFNTDRLYYVGGEHFQSRALTVDDRGIIKGSTIGPMFYYGFKSNDFLLVSRNPHLRKAGLVNFDGICSEKTFVLHTKDERILLQKFMPFIFQNERFWKYAIANKHGSTNFFVNWSTLADYSFELPSIEQQKAISKLLWALNDTKKAYEDLIQKTDELVKSQFIEMFGAVDYPCCKLSDECDLITKGTTPTTIGYDFTDEGIRFIKIENIDEKGRVNREGMSFISKDCNDVMKRSQLKNGDVLFSIAGAIGRCAIISQDLLPANINQALAIIRLKPSSMLKREFLKASLHSDYVTKQYEDQKRGVAQLNLSLKNIGDLIIPVPPEEDQNTYIEFTHQSDKSKFELNEAIKDLDAMYKRIIKDNLS